MKYLFLDTNIFIHYKGYEDIPWQSLLDTSDSVKVVLASIVLREINGHKDNSKGRVRNKARKISEKFNNILIRKQQSRIPLIYCREKPIEEKDKAVFDLTVNDDRFLLNVLYSPYPKEDVYIVSNDTDLLIKASESGLNILPMDETFRSAEEPTDEEKELKKTKEELAKWTSRCSNPKIVFCENGSECIEFEQVLYRPVEEIVNEKVLEESQKYPEEKDEPINDGNVFESFHQQMVMYTKLMMQHTPEEKACFNKMRNEYLEAFRKREILKVKKEMYEYAFKQLKVKVVNDGTAQTGDLHIVLRFPQSVKLYNSEESICRFKYDKPIEPQYNRLFADMASIGNYNIFGGYPDNSVKMWNPDKPSTKFEYVFKLSNLTHGLQCGLKKELYINTEHVQDFEIEWCIADSSLLDHKHGKLRVIVSDKNKTDE